MVEKKKNWTLPQLELATVDGLCHCDQNQSR